MLRAAPSVAPSVSLPTIQRAGSVEQDNQEDNDQEDNDREDNDQDDNVEIKEELDRDASDAAKRKRSEGDEEEEEEEADSVKTESNNTPQRVLQLDKALITLSTTPKAKWITLADLDQIKVVFFSSFLGLFC
jgi:hypothetical protein